VPGGSTLTALTFKIIDDAEEPANNTAGVSWTWTETDSLGLGLSTVANETSDAGGDSFASCTNSPGPLSCDNDISVSYTGSIPTVTLTVSAAAVNGGVGSDGNDSASLWIDYTYSNGVPEPATLSLVGAALFGLGMIARKLRKA
jgi:hypothetical protein